MLVVIMRRYIKTWYIKKLALPRDVRFHLTHICDEKYYIRIIFKC